MGDQQSISIMNVATLPDIASKKSSRLVNDPTVQSSQSTGARFLALTKPRLSSLVLMTTGVGFAMGTAASIGWWKFAATLIGTAAMAGAANAMNQCLELSQDRRMERTKGRPLVQGHLSLSGAWTFALSLGFAGLCLLLFAVNGLTALLGLAAMASYTLAYTPLKRKSTFSTLVGAIPGALPAAMGWTGATGAWGGGAWVLFAIVFMWQIPHFFAISWLYKDDYDRGGFQMITRRDPTGEVTSRLALAYTAALVPISLAPSIFGFSGSLYLLGAVTLGVYFTLRGVSFFRLRDRATARGLFVASIVYLPALFALMVIDKAWAA